MRQDEAVILFGIELRHLAGEGFGMHLHLAALLALVVEKSALGRLEGVAHRDSDIRVGEFFGMMRFAADDDLVAGYAHIDMDVVQIAGVMPAVTWLDRPPA